MSIAATLWWLAVAATVAAAPTITDFVAVNSAGSRPTCIRRPTRSLTAYHPGYDTYAEGDSLEIRFDVATNKANGPDALTDAGQVDHLLLFSQTLGSSYSAFWRSPQLLVIIIAPTPSATFAVAIKDD